MPEYVTDKQVLLEIRRIMKDELKYAEDHSEYCLLKVIASRVKNSTGFDLLKD